MREKVFWTSKSQSNVPANSLNIHFSAGRLSAVKSIESLVHGACRVGKDSQSLCLLCCEAFGIRKHSPSERSLDMPREWVRANEEKGTIYSCNVLWIKHEAPPKNIEERSGMAAESTEKLLFQAASETPKYFFATRCWFLATQHLIQMTIDDKRHSTRESQRSLWFERWRWCELNYQFQTRKSMQCRWP